MRHNELGRLYAPNEAVIRKGDTGDCMFIVQKGELGVFLDDASLPPVACLHSGDFFGEMSLFTGARRSATVRATSEARVLTVDETSFKRWLKSDPMLAHRILERLCLHIRRLNITGADGYRLPLVHALRPIAPLPFHCRLFARKRVLLPRHYRHGDVILSQGHTGEAVCLVEKGMVEIFHKTEDGDEEVFASLKQGNVFGQMSIFDQLPRRTGVRARGNAKVLRMDRMDFIRQMHIYPCFAFSVLRATSHRVASLNMSASGEWAGQH